MQSMEYFSLDILSFIDTVENGIKIEKVTVENVLSFKCRCRTCGESYSSHASLQSHIQISHLKVLSDCISTSTITNTTTSDTAQDIQSEKAGQELSDASIPMTVESLDSGTQEITVTSELPVYDLSSCPPLNLTGESGDVADSLITIAETDNVTPSNTPPVSCVTDETSSAEIDMARDLSYQELVADFGWFSASIDSMTLRDMNAEDLRSHSLLPLLDSTWSTSFDIMNQTIPALLSPNSHLQADADAVLDSMVDDSFVSGDNPLVAELVSLMESDVAEHTDNPTVRPKKAKVTSKRPKISRPKTFNCPTCGKSFKRQFHVDRHLKTHSEEKSYKCTLCDAAFRGANSLKDHLVVHSDLKEHCCDRCDEKFNTKKERNLHTKTCKPPPIPVPECRPGMTYCQECGKTVLSRGFKLHMKRHEGRKFACSICGKQYSDRGNLIIHARSHNGVNPYQCNVCGKAFNRSWALRAHQRIHTGERPFQCQVCGRGFMTTNVLRKHMRVHPDAPKEILKPCSDSPDDSTCEERISEKFNLNLRINNGQYFGEYFILD